MLRARPRSCFVALAALLAPACSGSSGGSTGSPADRGADSVARPACSAEFATGDVGQPATITIDPSSVVSNFVPKRMFGVNAAAWHSKRDVQATQPKVQAAGNYFVRFPGGSRSDDYHWNGKGRYDAENIWVPDATEFAPGFIAKQVYRGSSSSYGYPSMITDGDPATRWLSHADTSFPKSQWAYVDLGAAKSLDSVTIVWGTPYATSFEVQTWTSSAAWPPPYQALADKWETTSAGPQTGTGEKQTVTFDAVTAQFVRILMTASSDGDQGAYSIAEITVSNGSTQLTKNVNSTSQSLTTVSSVHPASQGPTQDSFDFESFMAYLQTFSPTAEAMITVNVGSGTPEEAAAWVHFANVVKKYGIRYWQIGNEMEANWETGGPLNAEDYVRRYIKYYEAMKAEDSSIVILGPVSGGIGEPSDLPDDKTYIQDFIELLAAKGKASYIEGIDFHWYPNWETVSDDAVLATVDQLADFAADVKSWLAAAGAKPDVPVFLTEYNTGIGAANPPVYNNQLVGGLWLANTLGEYIRSFGNGGTFLWLMFTGSNTNDWSIPTAGDLGYLQSTNNAYLYQEHANYWAMQMMSSNWAIAGDTREHHLVSTTSSQSSLAAYADLRPDDALTLAVINRSASTAYRTQINLGSFAPGQAADVWTFDAKNYAWNTSTKPFHAEPNTAPTHALTCGAAAATPFTFAPASITVIRFAPPGAPTAVIPDASAPKNPDAGAKSDTQEPAKNLTLVDDMETTSSGPILLSMGSTGKTAGSWFAAVSTGSTENTVSPNPFEFSALSSPHDTMAGVSSEHAAHVTCSISDQYGYCQVGFNLTDPESAFDLSQFGTLVFWGRSSISNNVKIQIPNDDTVPAGGKCAKTAGSEDGCWNSFASYQSLTDAWQKFEIKFSEVAQDSGWGTEIDSFDPKTVRGIVFAVLGPSALSGPPVEVDFWIDDVYLK